MYIRLFNGFTIKIIGTPGKKLLTTMFIDYYDAQVFKTLESSETVHLCIFLGKDIEQVKSHFSNSTNFPSMLISILSKKDYEFVASFCKINNLRLYIAPLKKITSMYRYLNLPFFDYIHLSLAASASKLAKMELSERESHSISKAIVVDPLVSSFTQSNDDINVSLELIGVSPEKSFHIRSCKKESVDIVWEPGTQTIGNRLVMEWLRNNNTKDVYTIIDIDTISSESSELKDYLLPFTTLGIRQKAFLIVNSDVDSESTSEEPFDYYLYTTLMELWNTKHYIPKRKALLESIPGYAQSEPLTQFDPKFEESILKPPIFIIDFYDSIKNFTSKISNCIVLYIGKEENYRKLII